MTDSRAWLKLGVWGLVFTLLLSVIGEDAFARGRRGRGGKGKAAKVRARGKVRKGGGGKQRQAGRKQGGGQGRGRGLAVLPANNQGGQGQGAGQIQDFGPAAVSPGNFNQLALGNVGAGVGSLQVIPGFNNIALNSQGQPVELNPGSIVNGVIVDQNGALRQSLVRVNGNSGSVISGLNGAMLPGAAFEIQQFNQGNIPRVQFAGGGQVVQGIGNFGGVNQVRSLRNQ